MDYNSTHITATFTAGTTRAMVNVPVTNDDIVEAVETFNLSFAIPSSLQGQVVSGINASAAGIITDDDSKKLFVRFSKFTSLCMLLVTMVEFSPSLYVVDEGDGPVKLTLILSNPLSFNIIVEMFNIDGSARGKYASILKTNYYRWYIGGGVDYGSVPYNVTFPAGATTVEFDATINDDKILEKDENFMLIINSSSLPDRVVVANTNNKATVTIMDDDGIKIAAKELQIWNIITKYIHSINATKSLLH